MELIKNLTLRNEKKILMLVIDGLGGLSSPDTNKTELETAHTPHIDELAKKSACGLTIPIYRGITPGSGPAHLSLFGYDPIKYQIGRGVLEALGINVELDKNDLAARANFATIDQVSGLVTDRRAGRLPTEKTQSLCKLIRDKIKKIEDIEVVIKPGKGHRFVIVFRGQGLTEKITENDPQKNNSAPKLIQPLDKPAEKTARIVNKFLQEIIKILHDKKPANYALLRGFSKYPVIPHMSEIYKLKPAAIATYPMYRGLSKLVGMEILTTGETLTDEIDTLKKSYDNYDFFYFHIKAPDALGEDGNFDGKTKKLEEIDKQIPKISELKPDVLIVAGDHSTPALLKGHSWHPVPFLLCSPYLRKTEINRFTEKECLKGSLGIFPATEVMPLALANALKLTKYGA